MHTCYYAIIPDGTQRPAALFDDLADAMDWGVKRYGDDRFTIRHIDHLHPADGGCDEESDGGSEGPSSRWS